MSAYTLAQKAKSIVAFIGAIAAGTATIAGYLITSELIDDNAKAYAATVAAVGGVVVAVATRVATFKIPNAPTEDAPPPPDAELEGTH